MISGIVGGEWVCDVDEGSGEGNVDGDGAGDGDLVSGREDEGDMGADLIAISEEVREWDIGADMERMGAEAAGAEEEDGEGDEVKGIMGLEVSDECWSSSNRRALRRASFSRRASLSSSSVSARLMRSVATILLACNSEHEHDQRIARMREKLEPTSSNKAWDNDSSSASRAAFSSPTFFFAARSFWSCSFNSSSSFACAGKDGNDGEFK